MHEYYAVKRGHHPGVYGNWEEAHNQVRGALVWDLKEACQSEDVWQHVSSIW